MLFTDKIRKVNDSLKHDRVKVSIGIRGNSLTLRATLPIKPGDEHIGKSAKQYELSLGFPANPDGLKAAESEARVIGLKLACKTFEWTERYLGRKEQNKAVSARSTACGDLISAFERSYFAGRERNRKTERTWNGSYLPYLSRLPQDKPLTKNAIERILDSYNSKPRSRELAVIALKSLCKFTEFSFPFDRYRVKYDPKPRELPATSEIESTISRIEKPLTKWVAGMLFCYGLRPHEILFLKCCTDGKIVFGDRWEITVEDGKTGGRKVYPIHPTAVSLNALTSFPFYLHADRGENLTYDQLKRLSGKFSRSVKTALKTNPYNLRHLYAIECHRKGIKIATAAKWMGHSVSVHTQTYQRWMDQSVHDEEFDSILGTQPN